MSAVAREAGRTRGNPQKFLLLTLATQGQGQRSARGLRRAPSKKKSVLNPMHRAPMRAGADWGDCILSIVIECTLYTRATEIEIKRNAVHTKRGACFIQHSGSATTRGLARTRFDSLSRVSLIQSRVWPCRSAGRTSFRGPRPARRAAGPTPQTLSVETPDKPRAN
jgi:hypothetical protein